jgi:hypothetical protein
MAKRKLKPGRKLPDDVAELFEKHQKYVEAGRANYNRADKVLEEILARCEVGCTHTREATGKKPPLEITVVDQFADRNAVWSGSSCKRLKLEAKEVKPQDR